MWWCNARAIGSGVSCRRSGMTRVPSSGRSPDFFRVAVAVLLAGVVGLYLAGYFFLMAVKLPPHEATPLTTYRYWQHYGEQPDIQRVLLMALAGGEGLALGAIGVAMLPRRRPLHGDARF